MIKVEENSINLQQEYDKLLEENKRLRKELQDYIKYKDSLERVIESDRTLIQVYEKSIKYYKTNLEKRTPTS